MKRWSTRFRTEALVVLVALLSAGCVLRGTHLEVVSERNQLVTDKAGLETRVEHLEASNESLGGERVALLEEMEDLRQEREDLDRNVTRLRRAEAELSEKLETSNAELEIHERELDRLRGTYEGLVSDLEEEVADGQIQIEQLRSGLRLNLTQDVLFASGRARLNEAGISVVRKVAARLGQLPNNVEVQGHTDDVPISSKQFPSNWELAAARATQVVRLLAQEGLNGERLRATSFGEFQPAASNETDESRAKNRRIEIRLEPAEPEPPAHAADTR